MSTQPNYLKRLTDRQVEAVSLLAGGHTIDEAAKLLKLSPRTVKCYAEQGRWRLGVPSSRHFARALVVQGYRTAEQLIEVAA